MKIDVIAALGAVTRKVEIRPYEGKPAHVVHASRTFSTHRDDLWDAITSKERLPRWFTPISGDLRQGGRYALTGNASGTITECQKPSSFSLTWEFGGEVSWLEVKLKEQGKDKTLLELEHIARVDEKRWAQFGPGAVGVGWDLSLAGLQLHLEAPDWSVDPAAAEAWSLSPEGRSFSTGASDDWCRASIAAGTDKAAARAAADRTTAFYTGVGEGMDTAAHDKEHQA
jgi:uncharacterized protein YndB with AHSA1/START domain